MGANKIMLGKRKLGLGGRGGAYRKFGKDLARVSVDDWRVELLGDLNAKFAFPTPVGPKITIRF